MLLVALAAPAAAAAGVAVHSAEDVLAHWTVREGSRLYFQGPDGVRWELVTSIDDPAILNRGSGTFHPVEEAHVEGALAAIDYPLDRFDAEIFILPFPRRALLDSSAEGLTMILSPGVWPPTEAQAHMLVAHEMGHLVQHALVPDYDGSGWEAYRRLRDLEDTSIYHEGASHRNRPHEIFAEDFRVLFGGVLAAGSGRVENHDLAPPETVPGLREFFLTVAERRLRTPVAADIVCSPNPTPAGARIVLASASSAPVEPGEVRVAVFDVQGRRVAQVSLDAQGRALWDGRLEDGSLASPGVYFLRAASGPQRWAGKLLIAR